MQDGKLQKLARCQHERLLACLVFKLTTLHFDSHFRNISKKHLLNDRSYICITTLTNNTLRLTQAYLEAKKLKILTAFLLTYQELT